MFTVLFTASATKSFHALSAEVQGRMKPKIDALASNPHPPGAKKLQGEEAYRIRVGDYRVVYEIKGKQLIVLVLRIGHRRDIYR
jgi:mRNA interferase RelE/StbE